MRHNAVSVSISNQEWANKMNDYAKIIEHCANQIRQHCKHGSQPTSIDTMVILGSGLGDIVTDYDAIFEIPYNQIEGLPNPTAPSHIAKLTISRVADRIVAFCQGRFHLYEGYSPLEVSLLVYALSKLGVKQAIITNAAGALNAAYRPGDIMVIEDHINLTGKNPLIGLDDCLGNRFVDMSNAYDTQLRNTAFDLACQLKPQAHLGIYAGVLGPSLETSAERRMLHTLGSDAVGMSTVTEVIAANHCEMKALGLSAISNVATGSPEQKPDSIEEVLHYAGVAGEGIKKIISAVLNSAD